ncbi:hypothetical protein FRB99_008270, partial [Tulasnella sp. 403]
MTSQIPVPLSPSPISYDSDVDDRQLSTELGPLSGLSSLLPVFPPRTTSSVKGFDLLPRIKGLYRLLDLYSENTTSGLVDKIIISQESLKSFLDAICPGSYKSVTEIDFHALDLLPINAIGIYGSKTEIVRFLRNTGAVDDKLERRLLAPHDTTSIIQPHLRSGVYALIPPNSQHSGGSFNSHAAIYTIYWPEETTWDDDAIGTVRKNRVTFMRYLTRLTDQVCALISPEHLSALVWKDMESESDSPESDLDDDFHDRFFKFEVAKANDQEEDVGIREGFKVSHPMISTSSAILSFPDRTSRLSSLDPILLHSETCQAFADKKYISAQTHEETIDLKCSFHHLRAILRRHGTIYLAETIDYRGLEILLEDGALRDRIPELYRKYNDAIRKVETSQRTRETDETRQAMSEVATNHTKLRSSVREYVTSRVAETFPILDFDEEATELAPSESLDAGGQEYFHNLRALYPAVDEVVNNALNDKYNSLRVIKASQYKAMKGRFFILQSVLKERGQMPESERKEAIATLISGSDATSHLPLTSPRGYFNPRTYWTTLTSKWGSINHDSATWYHTGQNEDDPAFVSRLAHLADEDQAYAPFANEVCNLARASLLENITSVTDSLVRKIESAQEKAIKEESRRLSTARALKEVETLRAEYRRLFQEALIANSAQPPLVITSVTKSNPYSQLVDVRGYYQYQTEAKVQHRLWALETPEHDMLRLQEDQRHQPRPQVLSQPVSTYTLPLTWNLRHIQVFNNRSMKHVLLIIDLPGSVGIWLFPLLGGVSLDKPTKSIPNLNHCRYTLAYDEQLRLLAIVMSDPNKCICHILAVDESFANIQGRGSPFDLLPWYQNGIPNITIAAFFAGTENLCLVEETGRVRVFSLLAQSFKPGTIRLSLGVCYVQASPDGTALVAIEQDQHGRRLRVFHLASFGHKDTGITTALPVEFNSATSFTLTSIGDRRSMFLLALSPSLQCIHSVALDISRKETEYRFRAKAEGAQPTVSVPTVHNALIDCFSEVWSRYPVVAAIQRETFVTSKRLPPSITFVSEDPDRPFELYFKQMILNFEQRTKKSTEKRLGKVVIEAARFEELEWGTPVSSTYRTGEWLAELLCLVPIHIALVRENRFVPLKDGILDPALERQLLGAEVPNTIDAITIGWYEFIFNSYMGFQTSTLLLDLASNPKLFKGLLAIIIKDVVDDDKQEIVKEFSQIVSTKQTLNFITMLHNSQLTVIPWTVIQSREFYTLFSKLKKRLLKQRTTHATAGQFLKTLKTAQDRGSVDQPVIKHGVAVAALTAILPSAFTIGRTEVHPAFKDLKNLDDQEAIIGTGSEAVSFYIGKSPQDIEKALSAHLQNWKPDAARHSIKELQAYLKDRASLRLAHVQAWFDENTSWLATDNVDTRELRRLFDDASTALLANIQLCLSPTTLPPITTAKQITTAKLLATMLVNIQVSNIVGCRLDTQVVIHVKGLLTCAVKPVPLTRRKAVKVVVRSPAITKMTNTFVRPERTNAECHVIYKESSRRMAKPTIVQVCASSHMILIMTNIVARTDFPVRSNVNCVSVTAHWAITSTALPAIRYTSAGKNMTAVRNANCRAFAKWFPHRSPSSRSTLGGTILSSIPSTPKLPVGCAAPCESPQGSASMLGLMSTALKRIRFIIANKNEPESEHIKERMLPNPDRPKDWVSHKVFWARTGFRDPYSRVEQAEFSLCDVQCVGAEHNATASAPARPSYCTLPIFHPPQPTNWQVAGNDSYVSADGHSFNCSKPNDAVTDSLKNPR